MSYIFIDIQRLNNNVWQIYIYIYNAQILFNYTIIMQNTVTRDFHHKDQTPNNNIHHVAIRQPRYINWTGWTVSTHSHNINNQSTKVMDMSPSDIFERESELFIKNFIDSIKDTWSIDEKIIKEISEQIDRMVITFKRSNISNLNFNKKLSDLKWLLNWHAKEIANYVKILNSKI